MSHRSTLRRRVSAAAFVILLLTASAARAQDVPFAFLIVDGWKAFYAGYAFRTEQQLTSWYGRGQIHVIVNGQKGADVGTARMHAFARAVPDPAFAGIRPLAGLISMVFGSYRAHLTVIETPTGLKTTVAFLDPIGQVVDTRVSGVWALADGSVVGGGKPDDLVVGGVVHVGTPLPAATPTLTLWPYFPLVPFHNDLPFRVFSSSTGLKWQVGSGSSYNNASGPTRTYMRSDVGSFNDDHTTAITVWHLGGEGYVILSCSWSTPMSVLNPMSPVNGCTVSGLGPLLGRLTGNASAYEVKSLQEHVLKLQLFLAP